jgi:hypothetical protein
VRILRLFSTGASVITGSAVLFHSRNNRETAFPVLTTSLDSPTGGVDVILLWGINFESARRIGMGGMAMGAGLNFSVVPARIDVALFAECNGTIKGPT